MEIKKINPEYYYIPRVQNNDAGQRGSPAFKGAEGNIFNTSPQGFNSEVNTDVFELKEKINQIDQKTKSNPLYDQQKENPFIQKISPTFDPSIKNDYLYIKENAKKADKMLQKFDKKVTQNQQIKRFEKELPAVKTDDLDYRKIWTYLGVLPPVRRVETVPIKIDEGNIESAIGQIAVAGLNIFGDGREVGLAVDEGKNIYNAVKTKNWGELKNIFRWKGQHSMTMLDGTVADGLVKKSPLLRKLYEFDDVVFNTRFGEFLQDKLNLKIDLENSTSKIRKPLEIPFTNKKINPLNSKLRMYNFEGNFWKKWVSGALHRISKLNLVTSAALEVPALIRSVTKTEGTAGDKTKAFGKQFVKSTGFIIAVNSAIALAGAALAPATFIGGLAVMAIGSAVGISASKEFNKLVDKISSRIS